MQSAILESSGSSVRDYVTLLKPGVMSLVVFTGLAGMFVAPQHIHPFLQCITLFCIALGSGAGGAINMWYDRDIDALMRRTAARPIPSGRIAPEDALAFGLFLAALSVALLGLAVNWLAAGILAFAIFFYAYIYTAVLKRATPQNIVIGGAAGAFPPVIGWAAVTGGVGLLPVILFLIVFLWTPPHFWALALYRSGDYAKANVPMLPVVKGVAQTKRYIFAYSVLMLLASLLPWPLGLAGMPYFSGAAALGGIFLWRAWRVFADVTDVSSKKLFFYSIFYLFALFSLLLVDHALHLSGIF